ncbi:uncharacterized protein EAE98_005175 [Botrytis deweyae]|uniref:Uncharacterized protein n=1 Tax=Botrytis deweyae TaxID=2478750 RepID=A0ABQ7IN47_9HELO|nr:uncharacterized protein EAE98_005175 [Botrytis deweyae]KAF7929256.1 hypothetical protein EAE98_005175 [Botrytis deweyae]
MARPSRGRARKARSDSSVWIVDSCLQEIDSSEQVFYYRGGNDGGNSGGLAVVVGTTSLTMVRVMMGA